MKGKDSSERVTSLSIVILELLGHKTLWVWGCKLILNGFRRQVDGFCSFSHVPNQSFLKFSMILLLLFLKCWQIIPIVFPTFFMVLVMFTMVFAW